MPNPGPDPGNELTDAKIAAAEARAERDLARLEGSLGQDFEGLRTDMATFRGDVLKAMADQGAAMATFRGDLVKAVADQTASIASFKGEVGTQLAGMPTKAEARSNMQWIIGTIAALMLAVLGLVVASFQTGIAVGAPPQKPPPGKADPATPPKAQSPVVVPAPGAEAPAAPQAKPAS